MGGLARIPVGQFAVVVGVITTLAWVFIGGSVALAASIIAGGAIALVAMSQGSARRDRSNVDGGVGPVDD